MDIRGLTKEQIEVCLERVNSLDAYNGNIEFVEQHYTEKRAKKDVEVTEHSYTMRAEYRVFIRHFDHEGQPTEWVDYGYDPYFYAPGISEEERLERERQLCEEKVAYLEETDMFEDAEYTVVLVPEHEHTYTTTHDRDYKTGKMKPLNKRGDRYSVRLKVKSTRRPGSRVSQERWSFYGIRSTPQKRINAACWHAHRDFLREVFDTNPDAKVISALATYDGEYDFETKFENTYHGGGMSGPASVSDIGGACNCDEGDYPEFATEGLTDEQEEMRQEILFNMLGDADFGHGFSQKRANAYDNLREGEFEKVLTTIRRAG